MLDDNILRGTAWIFGAVSVMMLLIRGALVRPPGSPSAIWSTIVPNWSSTCYTISSRFG